jgi:hypothetical protein
MSSKKNNINYHIYKNIEKSNLDFVISEYNYKLYNQYATNKRNARQYRHCLRKYITGNGPLQEKI